MLHVASRIRRRPSIALFGRPSQNCQNSGLQRASFNSAVGEGDSEPPTFGTLPEGLPSSFVPFCLRESWQISPDSKVLRFNLPNGISNLTGTGVCNGVKVRKEIMGQMLDKSYSPISLPEAQGYMDLLVKAYEPRSGGGLGHFLCSMCPGEEIEMKIKPPRLFAGLPWAKDRWSDVGLVGCGTGVAPLLHYARVAMADPLDLTRIWFISAHRTEQDIFLQEELEHFAKIHPERFRNHFVLSQPSSPEKWKGSQGRVELKTLLENLPCASDTGEKLVIVCGTDGFLETVCGGHVRVSVPGKTKKKKLQGPLRGFLAECGFKKEEVVKL